MRIVQLKAPLNTEELRGLQVGDRVFLSGTIYTARDAAHKRLLVEMEAGKEPPFPLEGAVIYYTGPCPGVLGKPITSAGPTTSGRMDVYTPLLLSRGVRATVGKGPRSKEVLSAMKDFGAVYLVATGGAGVLLAQCISNYTCISYPELGPEAILQLEVQNMPLIVAGDAFGNDIYSAKPNPESRQV